MSVQNQSYYVPAGEYEYGSYGNYGNYGSYGNPGYVMPSQVTQTYVTPPRVSEVHINQLLPFQVSPTYTVNRWIVRSNVADRGQLANHMLLAWRPEALDYGSDVDTTTLPQVYLFPDEKGRMRLQQQLYNDYPELNLQSYSLKVPVRIATHTYPGANLVRQNSYVIPGLNGNILVPGPTSVETVRNLNFEPVQYPPEVTQYGDYGNYANYDNTGAPLLPNVQPTYRRPAKPSKRSKASKTSQTSKRSKPATRRTASRR